MTKPVSIIVLEKGGQSIKKQKVLSKGQRKHRRKQKSAEKKLQGLTPQKPRSSLKSIFDFPRARSEKIRSLFWGYKTIYSCPKCYLEEYQNQKIETKEGPKTIYICKNCGQKFCLDT